MHSHSIQTNDLASSKIVSMSYCPSSNTEHNNSIPLPTHFHQFTPQNGYPNPHNISHPASQVATPPPLTSLPLNTIQIQPQNLTGYTPPQKMYKLSSNSTPTHLCVEACQTALSTQRASVLRGHIASFLDRSRDLLNLMPGASEKIR